jgi:hypothetical protein
MSLGRAAHTHPYSFYNTPDQRFAFKGVSLCLDFVDYVTRPAAPLEFQLCTNGDANQIFPIVWASITSTTALPAPTTVRYVGA